MSDAEMAKTVGLLIIWLGFCAPTIAIFLTRKDEPTKFRPYKEKKLAVYWIGILVKILAVTGWLTGISDRAAGIFLILSLPPLIYFIFRCITRKCTLCQTLWFTVPLDVLFLIMLTGF